MRFNNSFYFWNFLSLNFWINFFFHTLWLWLFRFFFFVYWKQIAPHFLFLNNYWILNAVSPSSFCKRTNYVIVLMIFWWNIASWDFLLSIWLAGYHHEQFVKHFRNSSGMASCDLLIYRHKLKDSLSWLKLYKSGIIFNYLLALFAV